MKWWKNLSIKTKFISVISLVILVTIASVVLSALTFRSLRSTTDHLYENMEFNQLILTLEIQHLQWVNTLSAFLVNPEAKELSLATDPTQCGLGKWYYGDGRENAVNRLPSLKDDLDAIEAPHKALHATAASIATLKNEGRDNEARALFQNQTLPALKSIQEHMASIRSKVAEDVNLQRQAFNDQVTASSITQTGLGLASIAALVALALFLFYSILKPCQAIILYSQKCREGSAEPLNLNRTDELGKLADNLTDLTQHLHKELSFSKGVLDGITVPCAVFCPEDKTLFTNKQMLELMEREGLPEHCLGMTSGELAWGEKGCETLSTRALKERCKLDAKMDYTTHKGNGRHVMVTSAPLYDAKENLLGTIAVWIDVTEVVKKQEALEENSRHIAEMAVRAQEVANAVSTASESLSGKVGTSSQGAVNQRDRMAETASAMTEMNATVLEVARSAGEAATLAEEASVTAQSGAMAVRQVMESIHQVEDYAGQLKEGVYSLGQQADSIGDIIGIINEIADQTNLLALNAAIEAARAGDAGRGFAVVADEVRKLAEKTMQATQQVNTAVGGIQQKTHGNMQMVDKAAQAVATANDLATRAGEGLGRIVSLVENTAHQIQSIATASEEQSATSEQINRVLEEVSRIAGDTSEAMGEASVSVESLSGQALSLRGIIERLQGGGSVAGSTAPAPA